MFIMFEYFRSPGTTIPYKEAAESVCRQMGWDPMALVPTLPMSWHTAGHQTLSYGTPAFGPDGSRVELTLRPQATYTPTVPLWVVVATYIEINRATLFALREQGNPSTLLDTADENSN